MKEAYCEHIQSSIVLGFDGYKYCISVWKGPDFIPFEEDDAWNKNEKRRINLINDLKKGLVPANCVGCPDLHYTEKQYEDNDLKRNIINKITIFNHNHCNCKCFYCCVNSVYSGDIARKSSFYDVLPLLKNLETDNRISNNTFIAFNGGEPTMLEEFNDIANIALKHHCKTEILSNGIVYNEMISKLLIDRDDSILYISLDCGTNDTFKKMKIVDKFNDVILNIKKYIEDLKKAGKEPYQIRIKYIIFPNVNDNKKEIDAFFKVCQECGVRTVARAVNHNDRKINSSNKNMYLEASVIKSYNYFKEQAENYCMNLILELWAEAIIENKFYTCRKISPITRLKSEFHFRFGKKY